MKHSLRCLVSQPFLNQATFIMLLHKSGDIYIVYFYKAIPPVHARDLGTLNCTQWLG